MLELPRVVNRQVSNVRNAAVLPHFILFNQRERWGVLWQKPVRCERDGFLVVHVPVVLRHSERQVRLAKADGEEERFALRVQFSQRGDRVVGNSGIATFVWAIVRPAKRSAAVGLCERNVVILLELCEAERRLNRQRRVCLPVRPRRPIVQLAVVDLAVAACRVPVLPEALRQCDHVRHRFAEVRLEVPDLSRVRPRAGHHAGSRRRTHRLLAVGSLKHHAPRGEAIDVGCLDDIVAVATEFRPQVV